MTWVLLDDQFPQHPKVVGVGPLGIAMQVAGLCYCNRYLTDGFIPTAAVPGMIDFSELDEHAFNGVGNTCWRAVDKLVQAGMWVETETGFQIHDYLDYQRSKAEIEAERGKTLDRVHKYRNARRNATVTVLHQECNGGVTGAPNPNPDPDPVPNPISTLPPSPDAETAVSSPTPVKTRKRKSVVPLGDDFEQRMITTFPILGPSRIHDGIEAAMNHKARLKWDNMEIYVRNWLRGEAERVQGNSIRSNGQARQYLTPAHTPREAYEHDYSNPDPDCPTPERVGI